MLQLMQTHLSGNDYPVTRQTMAGRSSLLGQHSVSSRLGAAFAQSEPTTPVRLATPRLRLLAGSCVAIDIRRHSLIFDRWAQAAILLPFLLRLRREKVRLALALGFFLILFWAFTWLKALVLTVDVIALLEFRERLHPLARRATVLSILSPALYLFAGFLLVFAYNDIILSVRFYGATDTAFNAMDKWLLRGTSVSDLCHFALRRFPVSFFRFLEFIYFGMFPKSVQL